MGYFFYHKLILYMLTIGSLCNYIYGDNSSDVTEPHTKSTLTKRARKRTAGQKKKNTTLKQMDEAELKSVQQEAINIYGDNSSDITESHTKSTLTKRARKRSAGQKKKNTTLKQMDEIELKLVQQEAVNKKNFSLAIKCLERRMRFNPEMLANLIFELGEMQFEFGKLDLTIITLNDFKKRFPGHKDIEEAHYKTCVASILNTLGSERDQTNTDLAITIANEYLNHPAHFAKYRCEVEAFKQQALKQKANHELMICEFHKKRGHLTAVKRRIDYIEKEFLTDLPELNSQILALKDECLALEQKKQRLTANTGHKNKKFKERF